MQDVRIFTFLIFTLPLIIPPLIYPARLDHFQVAFVAFLALAFKIGYFQHPLQELGKADAVYLTLPEIIAKALIELHGYIFVVIPFYRRFVMSHNCLFFFVTPGAEDY